MLNFRKKSGQGQKYEWSSWCSWYFFSFFLSNVLFFLMGDCQESKGNGVISRPPSPYFRCAEQTPSKLRVLALASYSETLNSGANCGVL